jgi:DnaJ-domain-containing protein 1
VTLAERIWRVARRHVIAGLGKLQGPAYQKARDRAWAELEEFLRSHQAEARARASRPRDSAEGARNGAGGSATTGSRPKAPPPHPYLKEYRLLEAPVGADLQTVRGCWRRLVRENHPDRFAGDLAAQRRASERLRAINEAYQSLKGYLAK